ncbi:MAG: OmpA family protein [Burkholderiales bacterium]|jgi:outer membrane protein OmpA-like peptidoglycan-associated protein
MYRNAGIRVGLALIVSVLLVTGCETIDPYTGETKVSNTTKGAAIGAAAGAVVGAISGDNARERRQRALIGAGVGGLAGGAVGAYMDSQEAELRKELENTGVSVTRNGDEITLNMPSNVTFAFGSSDLDPKFFAVLDSVAKVIVKYNKTLVEVDGHTDSIGSAESNLVLSERRANTVAEYLVTRGVKRERTIVVGAGEDYPVASNSTVEGRALNRRVELSLLPIRENG